MSDTFCENDLHDYIRENSKGLGPRVLVGPGDDLALLDFHGHGLLAGVDQVVEGVHFSVGTTPEAIGHKAVARNISDVAGMAGRPIATLASCVLPMQASAEFAMRLVESIRRTALHFNAPLIGGDTAVHRGDGPLTVSVTVLAEPISLALPPILRSGGHANDKLFVTGKLGGSLLADGTGRHLDFTPRLDEAESLICSLGGDLHAMMDISDGLAQDAMRLAQASDMQAVIDAASLPCWPGCGWQQAMCDGEDYELLFAASPTRTIPSVIGRGRTPISCVGILRPMPTPNAPRIICMLSDVEVSLSNTASFHRFGFQ